MSDLRTVLCAETTERAELRWSELTNVEATCSMLDPGPDPTYDPEPLPEDPGEE